MQNNTIIETMSSSEVFVYKKRILNAIASLENYITIEIYNNIISIIYEGNKFNPLLIENYVRKNISTKGTCVSLLKKKDFKMYYKYLKRGNNLILKNTNKLDSNILILNTKKLFQEYGEGFLEAYLVGLGFPILEAKFINEVVLNNLIYSNIFCKESLLLSSIELFPNSKILELIKFGFDKFKINPIHSDLLVKRLKTIATQKNLSLYYKLYSEINYKQIKGDESHLILEVDRRLR